MYKNNYIPGTTLWAERYNQWLAMGIPHEYMELPKVGIVNTFHSTPGSHLTELSQIVQNSVWEAGGLPFEFAIADQTGTPISERKRRKLGPQRRDRLASDIVNLAREAYLEGLVFISADDHDAAAHILAARRLDIPTLILPGGYRRPDVAGVQASQQMAGSSVTDSGYDCDTTSSMQMVAEALGMCLPGSTPIQAGSLRLRKLAFMAGQQIVRLVEDNILPSTILTSEAFENAVKFALATGASFNTMGQLAAIGASAEKPVDVIGLFERYAQDATFLPDLSLGTAMNIPDGGTRRIMAGLESYLNLDAATVSGRSLGKTLCRREADYTPWLSNGGNQPETLSVLRGNLAPAGALLRLSVLPPEMESARGPARVFNVETEDAANIKDIQAGDIVVLQGHSLMEAGKRKFETELAREIDSAGLSGKIIIISDSCFTAPAPTLSIGLILPDVISGGPLAVVSDGDVISLNFITSRIQLEIDNNELERRLDGWQAGQLPSKAAKNSLTLKVCWCSKIDDENYLGGGNSIHAGLCTRKKMLPTSTV